MAAISLSPIQSLRDAFDAKNSGTPTDPLASRPYIVTNESNCSSTRSILKAHRNQTEGVHIGVSCWENYNIILASNASYGIFFDKSKQVQMLNDRTDRVIAASQNRFEFMTAFQQSFEKEEMLPLLDKNDDKLVRDNSVQRLNQELDDPTSWLGSDENYRAVRKMYAEKRIVHIQMDATDEEGIKKIKFWLDKHRLHCCTFYLSNIRDWILNGVVKEAAKKVAASLNFSLEALEKENPESFEDFNLQVSGQFQLEKKVQETFLKILTPLITPQTYVIDAGYGLPRPNPKEQFPQYVIQGSEYLKGSFKPSFTNA